MTKELVGTWKIRKKKGGMKWVWKRKKPKSKKSKSRSLMEIQSAKRAASDHTTELTTDGGARPAG